MFTLGLEAFDVSPHDDEDLLTMGPVPTGGNQPPLADLIEHLLDNTALFKRLLRNEPRHIQNKVKQRLALLKTKLEEPPVVDLRQKVSFFLGVNNLCLIVWSLFARPDLVPPAFALGTAVLLPIRFWLYYQKAWHYFTFDLCYFVNVLVLGYLFAFPSSPHMMSAAFMLSNGPVIWAVIQWRNSLVFHSLDKTTSCLIHMAPCIVMYAVRWGLDPAYRANRFPGANSPSIIFVPSMLGAVIYYLLWQGLYYLMVDVLKKDKVESGARVTSFTYISHHAESQRDWVWNALNLLGMQRKLLMFMTLQFTYAVVTMLPTVLMYKYQVLHFTLLLVMFWTTVWNGATFYIDVFGKSYVDRFRAIQQEVAQCYEVEDEEDLTTRAGNSDGSCRTRK